MDLVGDYEINSEVVSPELRTFTEKTTVQTTLSITTQKILIPLDEREKEILIFSLIGIIVVMAILLLICMCRRKRKAIDFEMNRIVAGSSTTLFDKNRQISCRSLLGPFQGHPCFESHCRFYLLFALLKIKRFIQLSIYVMVLNMFDLWNALIPKSDTSLFLKRL